MRTRLLEHFARHELEALEEGFMDAPKGELARVCAPERLAKPITVPGWSRVWPIERDGKIVAHASLYDLEQKDIVFGHIGIERPYRRQGLARVLQDLRFAFLDEHQLTLTGAIYPGNDVSLRGCLANGFEILQDRGDGKTWVFRSPRAMPEQRPLG